MTPPRTGSARSGFTLVEILVATTLTLMMMAAVVQIFGLVGESVSDSRSTLEMNDRLRAATNRLQLDLAGVTAPTLPPVRMSEDPGYFEYVEGPLGVTAGLNPAKDADLVTTDQTVTDFDDILMFTTRSTDQPFVGRYNGGTVESRVAEVAWFVRGGNLYRRVLLVLPALSVSSGTDFYQKNDISVRNESGTLKANSLGDLTRREWRYAHPLGPYPYDLQTAYPYDVQKWGWFGLPTLGDTSGSWTVGQDPSVVPKFWTSTTLKVDFWRDPQPTDTLTTTRALEDVILSNVIGFDVKAWDPKAPVYDASNTQIGMGNYVDLGSDATSPTFADSVRDTRSGLRYTYDTWSDYYTAANTTMVNGFDDPNVVTGVVDGVVDDIGEASTAAPYAVPLRGIQVKIRVFEPDSRQIREVTVVQDFMPK